MKNAPYLEFRESSPDFIEDGSLGLLELTPAQFVQLPLGQQPEIGHAFGPVWNPLKNSLSGKSESEMTSYELRLSPTHNPIRVRLRIWVHSRDRATPSIDTFGLPIA